MQYAELQAKTAFSFLRGSSHPHEMVTRAAELGFHSLALTDNNGVYALPKAYRQLQDHPGLRLISGCELSIENHPSLTLIAKTRAGYGLMCRMITQTHADHPKGEGRLGWEALLKFLEDPKAQDLFVLPRTDLPTLEQLQIPDLRERIGKNLFLPLSRLLDGLDRKRTDALKQLSKDYDVPLVATNDAHYHEPHRSQLHDAMTAIRLNTTVQEAGLALFPNRERHLKSPTQMLRLFRDLPRALENTIVIAEACRFSLSELRYTYPSEWIPAGKTAQSYLERLTWKGAKGRYPSGTPTKVVAQIEHELRLIQQLKFADYFLTIWEIVEFARSKNILCQGRGSAANSIICYCLGITAIDPVHMDLLFERFISVERGEPPDIDVDFEHDRREEVIQHVYEKYGRHRAGMVSAIITFRSRMALRETRKALGVEIPSANPGGENAIYHEISYAAHGSRRPPMQVEESPLIQEVAAQLKGFPRHLGIHSGGFTLSSDPIIETVPVEPARMENRTIVQWDKEDLDIVGLLKVDLLSLGMLTAIRKTLDLVPPLTLATIPQDDRATYAMIQKADTVGAFQIESRAQMSMLPRLRPANFYDLVIQVALVRPGPIQGGMVHPFLRRRRGVEPVDVPHPLLEPILRKTLGVPLFQEQVMKMAMVLADFTPGEADRLRRAIGAWRSSGEIDRLGHILMERLLKKGLPQEFVERIFRQIQGFAEYGFPESHAASFALIAYASCYLKKHHPAEFLCGIINSQPMGFYSNHTLVEDAKHHGAKVLPVHPQISDWDCTMEKGALRLGWRVASGIGEEVARAITEERKKRPFRSLPDFLIRTRIKPMALQSLALADTFRCFGEEPRSALWKILAYANSFPRDAEPLSSGRMKQLSLFSEKPESWPGDRDAARLDSLTAIETIRSDHEAFGLSTRAHPMEVLRREGANLPGHTSKSLRARGKNGQQFSVAGMIVVRQKPPTANGVCFATLEDEFGFVDLVLFPPTLEKVESFFWDHSFFNVTGKLQIADDGYSFIVASMKPIDF